jgi:hypothetical protein
LQSDIEQHMTLTKTFFERTFGALWKSEREGPGALLARRTRTMKLCSSHARSQGQPWPLPWREE